MRTPYAFRLKKSTWQLAEKLGKPCYLIDISYSYDGIRGGWGFAVDTEQKAIEYLYAQQKRLNLKDSQITWIGLSPNKKNEQLCFEFY